MSELQNSFCWSWSRGKKIRECPRKYYYACYGCWGGWESDARRAVTLREPERARQLYVLKNSTTIPAWIGNHVHRIIAWLIQGRCTAADALERDAAAMTADVGFTLNGRYKQDPKNHPMIREVLGSAAALAPGASTQMLGEARAKVEQAVLGWLGSEWFGATRNNREIVVEQMRRFRVDGISCYCKVDCEILPGVERERVLLDWKTSRHGLRSEDDDQLVTYALARDPNGTALVVAYNPLTNDEVKFVPSKRDLEKAINRIIGDTNMITSFIVDGDRERNEPGPEDAWPVTDNERACQWCEYQTECTRWKT